MLLASGYHWTLEYLYQHPVNGPTPWLNLPEQLILVEVSIRANQLHHLVESVPSKVSLRLLPSGFHISFSLVKFNQTDNPLSQTVEESKSISITSKYCRYSFTI